MYASALNCCGAMELCYFIKAVRLDEAEQAWPQVLAQLAAQNAAQLICYQQVSNEAQRNFLLRHGFAPVGKRFTNPRTGSVLQLWILYR